MAEALDRRGATPRTLFKIILMLGCVLAGVAALAAEPDQTGAVAPTPEADCARTSFEFDGRTTDNDQPTDHWTLTCWRAPTAEAATTPADPARPVPATPVATLPSGQPGNAPAPARF